ncbi:TetR/AcrR family transcriptional regulator [Variovorax sp. PAMC26660]|uniref:TetR/AcrR family transcriptional regulator n=1 Tax=Variovorax sp. PAMC26660 TaxID=2762322 RepID=UPI00164D7BA5|nr:TetR/AcrR family transcriptional regulator [Variovorax sp. PAMC26660]QNK71613.1 TetR family transcriptional regulator [Variovorax sp. PAMC26660]
MVEAGTQVLGQRGWARFTTNEVAEMAGVSIGSLYQYFPNKLSLIEALRRRHFDDVLGVLQAASEDARPLEECVDSLVQGMLAVHGSRPALHRALLEEAPRSEETRSAHDAFDARYLQHYKTIVSTHRKRRGSKRDDIAAQVISAAMEGVVHHAALNGLLDSPELKRELVSLVCAYVRAPGEPPARRARA